MYGHSVVCGYWYCTQALKVAKLLDAGGETTGHFVQYIEVNNIQLLRTVKKASLEISYVGQNYSSVGY